MNNNTMLINGNLVDVTTIMDKSVTYIPTEKEASRIIAKGNELLKTYFPDRFNDDMGLYEMFRWTGDIGEFWKAKGWLIQAFKKHPFYNGNLQIVLHNQNMCRHINREQIRKFFQYVDRYIDENKEIVNPATGEILKRKEVDIRVHKLADKAREYRLLADEVGFPVYEKMFRKLRREAHMLNMSEETKEWGFMILSMSVIENELTRTDDPTHLVSERMVDQIMRNAKEMDIDFRAIQSGQKVSRLVQKLAKMVNMDKHVDIREDSYIRQDGETVTRTKDYGWNYQFAQFCDAVNPIVMKGTAVISVNPIDYWTMSFGKGWASCHTIDKENRRRNANNYSGCYCGGTESYMLDDSSVIFYFLDENYKGNEPENEDKVKRCVFFLGEDKLIQSRVYPDGRDGGEASLAGDVRAIMQKVVADIFDVPNYWSNSKGTEPCTEVIISEGPHYRDYNYYDDCNVSYMKRIDGYKNVKKIHVGTDEIICPCCGAKHYTEENILCENCAERRECYNCGREIDEDYAYHIDGEWYCDECASICEDCGDSTLNDDITRVLHDRYVCDYCRRNNYTWSEHEYEYVPNDELIVTEEGNYYWEDGDGYRYCDICGDCHDEDEVTYDDETGYDYCAECYADLLREREEQTEE